jgi:hypothetical protein
MKVFQEFYCGECQGYILIKLNMALNHIVHVVCPNCGHQHKRCIQDGQIFEKGRESGMHVEELCPPKSAYSKEPRSLKMESATGYSSKRDGQKIEKPEDINPRHPAAAAIFNERWFEMYGGKR